MDCCGGCVRLKLLPKSPGALTIKNKCPKFEDFGHLIHLRELMAEKLTSRIFKHISRTAHTDNPVH